VGTRPPVVCAVDVGTSAVRGALVLADGSAVAQARRERPVGQGAVTFDPERLWADVTEVLRELTAGAGRPVAALAIAGHVGTVLVEEGGTALDPGRGWADTTGAAALDAE
jgi:xylulokinase